MDQQNQCIQKKIKTDHKLCLKFQFIKKIGAGCFGTVYQAINRKNNKNVAIKLQVIDKSRQNTKSSSLFNEISIFQKLKGIQGIPKIYSVGKWRHGIFMEMQILSSSLNDQKNRDFTFSDIKAMAVQILQILKRVHQKGIIHQDLKPQNIMRNQSGNLLLIDFGLANSYNSSSLSEAFGALNNKQKRGFVGTPRYASLASHKGWAQQPKDDIQSLLYVLGSLYLKQASWFNLKAPVNERLQMIGKYKKLTNKEWFRRCGKPFIQTYQYLVELSDNRFPDYGQIINYFNHRQTVIVHSKNLDLKKTRRNSEPVSKLQEYPMIQVHQVKKMHEYQEVQNYLQLYQIRDNPSFSQMAQNGLQMVQLLTEKLIKFNDDTKQQEGEIETMDCLEPRIKDVWKYKNIQFKNPFQI